MRDPLRASLAGLAAVAGAAVGGCAGNGPTFPGLPELTGSLSGASIVGSPTEVYERIARGALSCWFGAAGPLKANYVYHAEADPPGKGGKAEISIHERNRIYDTPKGMRAYRITIAAEKEMATLAFENLKLPEPLAASMEADARRWGSGAIGCAEAKAGGWSENTPPPASSLPPEGKKKPAPKGN